MECLARLAGLIWRAEQAGGRVLMDRGWLGGGEQPGVVDAGKEQSSRSQRMNGWERLVGEAGGDRTINDQAGWAAGL